MLKIIETKGASPTNANNLICLVADITTPEEQFEASLPVPMVELLQTLNHLQQSLDLYPNTMEDLWAKIENYADIKK